MLCAQDRWLAINGRWLVAEGEIVFTNTTTTSSLLYWSVPLAPECSSRSVIRGLDRSIAILVTCEKRRSRTGTAVITDRVQRAPNSVHSAVNCCVRTHGRQNAKDMLLFSHEMVLSRRSAPSKYWALLQFIAPLITIEKSAWLSEKFEQGKRRV